MHWPLTKAPISYSNNLHDPSRRKGACFCCGYRGDRFLDLPDIIKVMFSVSRKWISCCSAVIFWVPCEKKLWKQDGSAAFMKTVWPKINRMSWHWVYWWSWKAKMSFRGYATEVWFDFTLTVTLQRGLCVFQKFASVNSVLVFVKDVGGQLGITPLNSEGDSDFA